VTVATGDRFDDELGENETMALMIMLNTIKTLMT
jgi:hypothetical protein